MAKAKEVKEANVISRWGVLVEGQAGKEERFFQLVEWALQQRGWPFPIEQIQIGKRGLFGKTKPYLETKSGKIVAYIGAETIGNDIYFGWNLTIDEGGFLASLGLALAILGYTSEKVFQNMGFNEVNSARAFGASLNYAVQIAVDTIMDETGLDKSKINREATGQLGRLI